MVATVSNRLIYETIIVQLTARREKSLIAHTSSLLSVSLSQCPGVIQIGHRGIGESPESMLEDLCRNQQLRLQNMEHTKCVKLEEK